MTRLNSVCPVSLRISLYLTVLDIGNINARVKAIFHNKQFVSSTSSIPQDASFGLILDRTSFYAESGGQEYDTGNIVIDGKADFEVSNVQVYNGYVLHTGFLKYGQIDVETEVVSSYDEVGAYAGLLNIANRFHC
jgi:alanyl-tRNA synthetase